MEPDAEVVSLRRELNPGFDPDRDRPELERFYVWRDAGGLLCVWVKGVLPPPVLTDKTADGLRARLAEHQRVYAETKSAAKARAAALDLDTS